ncbi:MAG: G5 domain-containing protein, partial [Ruminococcus sp.]
EDKITDGMKITVKRVEYKQKKVKESIGFDTEEQQSSSLNLGETQVTQEGENGEKVVTYKVKYVDGKETSKKKISEKVTKEPVNKIITVGTAVESTVPPQTTPQQTQNNNTQPSQAKQSGKQVVSKQAVYDCDGSGHGYYVITYSDGTTGYEEF